MARIEHLAPKHAPRSSRHAEVEATFHVFQDAGELVLQIDTYGAPGRATPGKVTQSLQLGPNARSELRAILMRLDA